MTPIAIRRDIAPHTQANEYLQLILPNGDALSVPRTEVTRITSIDDLYTVFDLDEGLVLSFDDSRRREAGITGERALNLMARVQNQPDAVNISEGGTFEPGQVIRFLIQPNKPGGSR